MLQQFHVLAKIMNLHDNGKTCIFVYKTNHFFRVVDLRIMELLFCSYFLCLNNDEIDIETLICFEL